MSTFLDQRGTATRRSRELIIDGGVMTADALAFIADQGLVRPIIFGHRWAGG
jgi:hypothetical protein